MLLKSLKIKQYLINLHVPILEEHRALYKYLKKINITIYISNINVTQQGLIKLSCKLIKYFIIN